MQASSWLGPFNFLKRILIVPLLTGLPRSSWVLPVFGNRKGLRCEFLPGVVTSGPCSPTWINQMLTLLMENPLVPFYVLKLIFRADKMTRKQDTWTAWFGLRTDCGLASCMWKRGDGSSAFSLAVGCSPGLDRCARVSELWARRLWTRRLWTRWPRGLGAGWRVPCPWALPPFEQMGVSSSCTCGTWDSKRIGSTANRVS